MRINSLTTRFLLALLLCTAVPFLAFGLYVRGEVRDREERQVANVYLPRWAGDAARKIARDLEYVSRVGFAMGIEAETFAEAGLTPEQAENVQRLFCTNYEIDLVMLANHNGDVFWCEHNPQLGSERNDDLDMLKPSSVKDYDWFQKVREHVPSHWVPLHVSPFLHRDEELRSMDPRDYSLGVACSVQLRGGDGVLFILLRWQQLQDVLDETTEFLTGTADFPSAQVFLCDKQGKVLAHSQRQEYGTPVQPAVMAQIGERAQGAGFFLSDEGEERGLGFASIQKQGNDYGSSILPPASYDWYVVLHAPLGELFEVSREFNSWLLLVVPLIALLVGALATLSSRAITRPVGQLSEATRRVAHGDLGARVEARGGDELADLGRAFNTMAGDLETSREQLRDAERQSAWAEMARQVAHEIKNPLTPMRMGAQMLLRARREEDPRWMDLSERLARNVIQQTEALDRIASDFRQFAGSPARRLKRIPADDLLAGVEELLASMAEQSAPDLAFEHGAGDVAIEVDVLEMRRVFLNLIHNAMEACHDGGSITVRSGVREVRVDGNGAGSTADGVAPQSSVVEFRIEDDGVGVPDEMRANLFNPYFTTKTSGTGLGLAICRRIIEAHGGDIKLESSAPPRTVFLLTVPVAGATQP